jgi:hypothetical protein
MSLWQQIVTVYPELTDSDFHPESGIILLKNDSDGFGDYIAKWEYSKPIPEGLTLGKPGGN